MLWILAMLGIPPRIILFILAIVGYLGDSFDSFFWPLMGFFFMPWTTLCCAFVWQRDGVFGPIEIIFLFFCMVADFGGDSAAVAGDDDDER